jgi:hypothetical protein
MLVIAERLPVPPAAELVEDCRETFRIRKNEWPPPIEDPPAEWTQAWEGFVAVYAIPWRTLTEAGSAVRRFRGLAPALYGAWRRSGDRLSSP